jgi:hypothetical protein
MTREKATMIEAIGWLIVGLMLMCGLAKYATNYR